MSKDDILDRLMLHIDNSMWRDHSEVSKTLLRACYDAIKLADPTPEKVSEVLLGLSCKASTAGESLDYARAAQIAHTIENSSPPTPPHPLSRDAIIGGISARLGDC